MRRGPGIAGLRSRQAATEHYRRTGEEVKQVSLAAMKEQMATFKSNLEAFARKYRQDIRKDPVFRAQFHTMCANIGVDPLASNKGVWAELLGFGDFYYELGVQLAEACLATRAHNGGLMELPALLRYVQRRRGSGSETISEDDVSRAIGKLKVLGNGYGLVTIGTMAFVRSVPGELNMDANRLLELAQEVGHCSSQEAMNRLGWSSTRIEAGLQALLNEGLAMVDDGEPARGRLYWFPCIDFNQG